MARRKPSERRNYKDEDMELNLVPMMNLISILIPALLISVAFVEIAVINVSAPSIGPSDEDPPEPEDDEPPLNLTVTITDKGYTLAASGAVLGPDGQDAGDDAGPTIPVKQATVKCNKYVNTRPPPRSLNAKVAPCENAEETQSFWIYDVKALTEKLLDIHEAFPDERRIIIAAEPDIEYEAITDVMDGSREYKDPGGELRPLFDEVVLSPGMTQES